MRYLCGMHSSRRELGGKVIVRIAMIVEGALQVGSLLVLRLRGHHRALIVPFIGHGTTERIRIGARVVLGRPEETAPAVGVPKAPFPTVRSRQAVLRASIAQFLTVEVPRASITATPPGGPVKTRADRDGYVDVVVDGHGLDPGWHDVPLTLRDGWEAAASVLVVDPDARVGLVSDVDDTILETGVSRGLEFLRATLLTEVHDRTPLPGAASLYRALVNAPGPQRPVFYLSTSPWNLHGMLLEFIALRRFPLGPLLLTDWGPSKSGIFRIGAQEHKLGVVRRLLAEHPQLGLILVGDSAQVDSEIYATLAREHPDRILAIYIRRTRMSLPRRLADLDALAAEITTGGVPMLAVDDSVEIAVHAASLGLLDESALADVRAGA